LPGRRPAWTAVDGAAQFSERVFKRAIRVRLLIAETTNITRDEVVGSCAPRQDEMEAAFPAAAGQ